MQNKEIEEEGFSIDLTEEQAEDFKKAFGLDELEEIHKRFENGTETIDDIKNHCLNYMIKTEDGVELKLVETKYFKKLIKYIGQLENKVKELQEAVEQTYSDYQDAEKKMFEYSEQIEQLKEKQLKEFLKLQSRKTFDYLEKMLNEKIGKIMIFTLKDLKELLKIIRGEKDVK